jgi:hypothetical protein
MQLKNGGYPMPGDSKLSMAREVSSHYTVGGFPAERREWGEQFFVVETYPNGFSATWSSATTAQGFIDRCSNMASTPGTKVFVAASEGDGWFDPATVAEQTRSYKHIRWVRLSSPDEKIVWSESAEGLPRNVGLISKGSKVDHLRHVLKATATSVIQEKVEALVELPQSLSAKMR